MWMIAVALYVSELLLLQSFFVTQLQNRIWKWLSIRFWLKFVYRLKKGRLWKLIYLLGRYVFDYHCKSKFIISLEKSGPTIFFCGHWIAAPNRVHIRQLQAVCCSTVIFRVWLITNRLLPAYSISIICNKLSHTFICKRKIDY